jgi:hypothetical protein
MSMHLSFGEGKFEFCKIGKEVLSGWTGKLNMQYQYFNG